MIIKTGSGDVSGDLAFEVPVDGVYVVMASAKLGDSPPEGSNLTVGVSIGGVALSASITNDGPETAWAPQLTYLSAGTEALYSSANVGAGTPGFAIRFQLFQLQTDIAVADP